MSFEELMDWQQSFRILQPITDEKYVHGLLQRLRASGLPLQDTECEKLFSKPDKVKDAQGLPVSPTKWTPVYSQHKECAHSSKTPRPRTKEMPKRNATTSRDRDLQAFPKPSPA